MQFGTATDSRRPLWAKIEAIAQAKQSAKAADLKAAQAARQAPMLEARRRHRARVTKRELFNHRIAAKLRDACRPERIIGEIAAKYGLTRREIVSPRKWRLLVEARQELCWRLYCETSLSSLQIGKRLGKDHTSVLHAVGAYMRCNHLELPPHRAEASQRYQPNA